MNSKWRPMLKREVTRLVINSLWRFNQCSIYCNEHFTYIWCLIVIPISVLLFAAHTIEMFVVPQHEQTKLLCITVVMAIEKHLPMSAFVSKRLFCTFDKREPFP